MKKIYNILLILVLFGLTNCSNLKKSLGFEKDVPDEFLIKKSDPIERPPNFELMPPDSKKVVNSKSKQNTKNNTKRIIDEVLKNNDSKEIASPDKPSSLEKDILNQIEKR